MAESKLSKPDQIPRPHSSSRMSGHSSADAGRLSPFHIFTKMKLSPHSAASPHSICFKSFKTPFPAVAYTCAVFNLTSFWKVNPGTLHVVSLPHTQRRCSRQSRAGNDKTASNHSEANGRSSQKYLGVH